MNTDPNSPAVALPAKRRHRRISLTQAMQVLYDVLEDSRCDPKTKLRALEMAEKFCDWKPRSQEASGVDGDDVNEMVLAEERRQKREQGQMRNESLELRERIT